MKWPWQKDENYSILMLESNWVDGPIKQQPLWSITDMQNSKPIYSDIPNKSFEDRYNYARINGYGMRRACII